MTQIGSFKEIVNNSYNLHKILFEVKKKDKEIAFFLQFKVLLTL
jgi:hypothetical protein